MKAGISRFILLILLTGSAALSGCGKKGSFEAQLVPEEQVQLKDIWTEFEDIAPLETEELDQEQFQTPPAERRISPSGRNLSETARWVVENESKKVGPACNFFIQRVMFLMGWGKSSWVANDFDKYVENKFESFRKESFEMDSTGAEKRRLKEYIWSFPERTGLILQWKRKVGHGHIGIIQRIGNEIVLYHASLNQFSPKAQKANLDILVNRGSRAFVLNVFSDFQKDPNPSSKAND